MVVFDRVSNDLVAPKVKVDNKEGGLLASEHLIEQGYKRITILTSPQTLAPAIVARKVT